MFTLRRTSGEVIALVRNQTVFGKDASACTVTLQHPSAARRHFHIELNPTRTGLAIVDLGTSGGTFVNGARISDDTPTRLSPNDSIMYGTARDDTFTVVSTPVRNEKLDKALAKLSWLQTEIERLKAKEGADGLSENQQRTLERYHSDIDAIEKTIAEQTREAGKKSGEGSGGEAEADAFWDSAVAIHDLPEHEMLDYTDRKQKQANGNKEVMTYDSLVRKLDEIEQLQGSLNAKIKDLSNSEGLVNGQDGDEEEEDELDKFMAANERNIQLSDLEKAQKQLEELGQERKRLEALANIARPALARMPVSTQKVESTSESPKVATVQAAAASSSVQAEGKRSAVASLFSQASSSSTAKPNALPIKYRILSDPMLQSEKRVRQEEVEEQQEYDKDREATWRPPTNQRGDGKTAANERFGY